MSKESWEDIKQRAKETETERVKERLWTNRIVRIIILLIILIVVGTAIFGYFYVTRALSPVNSNNDQLVEVTIPFDSTSDDVANILEENGIVRHADIFGIYMKANNEEALQAGHYEFSPSMDAQQVLTTIQAGGEPIFVDADTTITVIEGTTIDEIATLVNENTAITEEEFMDTVQDEEFITNLQSQFPSLLEEVTQLEGLNYTLEGYLFPATYDYFAGMTAQELITEMVSASNLNYQRLVDDLTNTYLSYHEVLSLASIIEREAITEEDRGLVSGVFYNRLEVGMPLQSDVTVLYALGEHREFVTYTDLEVDSPYNLYMYEGLTPGPIGTPSYQAIVAAIYPTWNDYYYFVADIDTQEIYYSSTIEEHDALVEEFVNSRQASIEEEAGEDETTTDEEVAEIEETEEVVDESVE
ncbi:endolytic transglycosylase MltG [Aerococcaceae bacterium INB8]|uniref:Endolytic murein transglycosylase n=1 Tax=Ruoffia halotolerans TaxID=2748684 RepID=A0A839A505_9LACT|nr:endolytic transglycosylase MltG [Ruoffia halotolerans]MBA5729087.1 endolytic transglycosylase MltG [Ruoffia halotolerans]